MKKQKFYVVWSGHNPGIYTSWDDCKREVEGFGGAKYKAFATEAEAKREFMLGAADERSEEVKAYAEQSAAEAVPVAAPTLPAEVEPFALAVDAACSGNPGMMEYRGVYLKNGREVFHFGPIWGTNNIGEFLAIVHALALMKQKAVDMPIYSDSRNAILWVRKRKCATKLAHNAKSAEVYNMVARAERWLANNQYTTRIIKWETSKWGEIPADFGRKH